MALFLEVLLQGKEIFCWIDGDRPAGTPPVCPQRGMKERFARWPGTFRRKQAFFLSRWIGETYKSDLSKDSLFGYPLVFPDARKATELGGYPTVVFLAGAQRLERLCVSGDCACQDERGAGIRSLAMSRRPYGGGCSVYGANLPESTLGGANSSAKQPCFRKLRTSAGRSRRIALPM